MNHLKIKGKITFMCSKCKEKYTLSEKSLVLEEVEKDERHKAAEKRYASSWESTCLKCRSALSVKIEAWGSPGGQINHMEWNSNGLSSVHIAASMLKTD